MNDTNPEIEARVKALLQQKSGSERFLMGCSMYEAARAMVLSSLRVKYPYLSPNKLKYEIFLRFYMSEYRVEQLKKVKEYLRMSRP